MVALLQHVDEPAYGTHVVARRVGAGIQALVALDHVREGMGEETHEVRFRPALQVHHVRAEKRGVVIGDGLDGRFELRRLRREQIVRGYWRGQEDKAKIPARQVAFSGELRGVVQLQYVRVEMTDVQGTAAVL